MCCVQEIVGVDSEGSILAEPPELNSGGTHFYEVEGIGYLSSFFTISSIVGVLSKKLFPIMS